MKSSWRSWERKISLRLSKIHEEREYTMFDFLKKNKQPQKLDITKDTKVGDILRYDMGIADVLIGNGMPCTGCMIAQDESLEMACYVHGVKVSDVLEDIHEYEKRKEEAGAANG